MEETNDEIALTIIIVSFLIVILAVFTLLSYIILLRKRRIMNKKKEELTTTYEKLLLQTKLEIQGETLNNISKEIHDNIGQVLSFVKLSLGTAKLLESDEKQHKIEESVQLLAGVISDLRDLSKSLSFDRIKRDGFSQAIKDDAERLDKSGVIKVIYSLTGLPIELGVQTDLILYRVFQELVNNTLKHAASKVLIIDLTYSLSLFTLTIKDHGKGFDTNDLNKSGGLGLGNIKERVALINGNLEIDTEDGKGCSTIITLKPDLN